MLLTSWGRYPSITSRVTAPGYVDALTKELSAYPSATRLIPRGAGRSYGDSALAELVISSRFLDNFIALDAENLRISCGAGVTLAEVLRLCVPRGLFPPVLPGTKYVSVGGAIAADIHGKNHHVDGTFCDHVESISLALASGELAHCSRTENSDLFHATCGGMGLTGVIIEARLKLEKVSSVSINTESNAAANLKESLTLLNEHNEKKYVVAWVDCLARGGALGRGIIHCGDHNNAAELRHRESSSIGVPFTTPGFLLNRATMATFNNLYFDRHSRAAGARQQHYDRFFFPLDSIRNWNRLYGSRGFLQYQFVVPDESAESGLTEILGAVSSAGKGSFLAVLKRFGAANQNLLSFPRAGLTLTLDFKFEPSLLSLLDELDAMVSAHGGRIYLAKDARMSEAVFKKGYPNWEAFKAIKDRVDPDGLFASMQSNRLGLSGPDMGSSTT